ncbi:hypothetical protein SMGD1_2566 [Sulfurimonas gotlandica GD1]|uniref:DUF695 domain-containing protein n=1 Tax=Sulfurimonas gotlandica (strain DSM 19862 / JCM 16533 / GD1) TaxID=929558 RepID=B6BJZ7_SULGG|nr:DUF695 domain-containing protein [Sulfurimonas gotlandica]EDZ62552.1 conserved hypothetical protein [Sulfurimonas gotlandica GD1]EHP31088.1 hypothetical protein SMGD1_2566 [Sulfurimonas gotlandica GD1]
MREIFNRLEDDVKVITEVNIEATDSKEMNPWLFSVFIKYDDLEANEESYEEFLETKESLIIALEHQDRAVYVGSRVLDGWNELYFYAYDSKKLDAIASKILTPSNYVYESNVVRDTKWGFYETQLFPTELEFCHIQSAKIIFLLEEEDEDLTIERDVEHYVSFETPTQKNRFINTLDLDGFSFKDEISSEEFEHGVALVKTHAVTEDVVTKVVEELFAKVKEDHGYYESWSTTLVSQELEERSK